MHASKRRYARTRPKTVQINEADTCAGTVDRRQSLSVIGPATAHAPFLPGLAKIGR